MKGKTIGVIILFICAMAAALYGYSYFSERYATKEEQKNIQEKVSLKKAADFTVVDEKGSSVKLSDYAGKPTIVNFWASWCEPCKSELPAFENAYKNYGDRINFMMVNLTDGSRETLEGVKKFISENGYSFPVFFDTQFNGSNAYNVISIPKTVVINADGTIADSYIGAISENKLSIIVDNLLNK